MISQITKLKNFGIYQDFSWNKELPDFKRINLIYGWNRSGKTTLSRVFASCEKKCQYDEVRFKQYPERGEFELKTENGAAVNHKDLDASALSIKVFNQDFIEDNISFDPSDSCNPIVYVSEADVESRRQLEKLRTDRKSLNTDHEKAKKDRLAKEGVQGNFLTGLGREISNLLFDKAYNKTKLENRFHSIGINNFSNRVLSDDERRQCDQTRKSEPEKDLDLMPKHEPTNFGWLFTKTKNLLEKKVTAEILERLKNPDDIDGGIDEVLNAWVKQGFEIHKTKNQFNKCLFCENELTSALFHSLARHFSNDYDELQLLINISISELEGAKGDKISERSVDIYADLRDDYEDKAKAYNAIIARQNDWISHCVILLETKKKNPFDSDILEMMDAPEDYSEMLNIAIDNLNAILQTHNYKIKNHNTEVANAKEKLELHSIAAALAEQDYEKMLKDIEDALIEEKNARAAVEAIDSKISDLERQTSNIGMAITDINKHLMEFFGREEIKLELDGDKKGYTIFRDSKPAKNLSEGEKTAIAFSYFIVKVGEGDFDKANGIIFIDDPISSFDSNSIYHCFSMLSTHFESVGQLFISTHNFQLFNLAKAWLIKKNKSTISHNRKMKSESKPEKPAPCEFFMIENYFDEDQRKARIAALDKTLKNYKSEYHFLYAKLKKFAEKPETAYEDFYTIGNMARRFFDIFADFKIPSSGDQKSKMDKLVSIINKGGEIISQVEVGKVYKLLNEFSHNPDPTSAIEHKDRTESNAAIGALLRVVKHADHEHFSILDNEVDKCA